MTNKGMTDDDQSTPECCGRLGDDDPRATFAHPAGRH